MKTMLIALVPLLLSAPAIAQAEPVSSRQVAVSTNGINLATADGAAEMLQRVRDAAERGCELDPTWDRLSKDFDRCRADTVAAAVAKIDAPLVTALHRGDSIATQVAAAK
jgi:UrcA family protein